MFREDIPALTSIRGVAALWVVLFHGRELLYGAFPAARWLNPLLSAGNMAVPLFFVLSGYVLGRRYLKDFGTRLEPASLCEFFFLRLGRIYPVHLVMLLVAVGMYFFGFFGSLGGGWGTSASSFAGNLFLVHAWGEPFRMSWNYPSWSISSEWFAYVLFPFLCLALTRLRWRGLVGVTVVSILAAAFVTAAMEKVPFQALALVVPPFVGGLAMALLAVRYNVVACRRWDLVIAPLLVILPYLVAWIDVRNGLYLPLFFVLVWSLASTGGKPTLWASRPLAFLGDVSYSLYMVHALILLLYRYLGLEATIAGSDQAAWKAALLGAALALIIVCAAISYHCVERPAREWSRRLVKARRTVPKVVPAHS